MPSESSLPVFGDIDGVQEGDHFPNRRALHEARVHRATQAGISGGAHKGADSVVMSGGYPDDDDRGGVIYYTGHGGRENGVQVRDQDFSDSGNAGLVRTGLMGKPVRVIEGLDIRGGKRRRAVGGYRYRGLYRVADCWATAGQEGFLICKFELRRVTKAQANAPLPRLFGEAKETGAEQSMRRVVAAHEVVDRDPNVVNQVKDLYNNTCQICGERLRVSPEEGAFSNCAHIHALGKPHNGPDRIENVLCLCPNCHVRFDRGALQITDDYLVVDTLKGVPVGELHCVEAHGIRVEYLQQHRSRWPGRMDAWSPGAVK